MNNNEEQPNRIPRPLGLTIISQSYQTQKTPEAKERIINHILTSYINQGFLFNGKACNLNELQALTGIPMTSIIRGLNKGALGLQALTNPEAIEDTYRAIQSLAIFMALEDRGHMAEQALILKASQGGEYKPFISSTLNQALKNQMDAGQNIMRMATMLQGPATNNIAINNTFNQQNNNAISAVEAVKMVEAQEGHKTLKDDEEVKAQLWVEYGLADCPEVNAKAQTGRGDKEGLGLKTLTDLKGSIEIIRPEDKASKAEFVGHQNRREEALDVDMDVDQI